MPDIEEQQIRKGLVSLTILEISKQVCDYFDILEAALKEKQNSRLAASYRTYVALMYTENEGSIKEVVTYFNRDPSSLSRQLITLKQQLSTGKILQNEVVNLKKSIYAIRQA